MDAVITPLELRIGAGEDIKMEVGQEIREALRREQLRALHDSLDAIGMAAHAMPEMDAPAVRGTLEELAIALRSATRACDALWYLAPEYDDGEPAE